jgi:hypothetical protein
MRNVTRKFAMAAAGVVLTATSASAQVLNFGGSAVFRDQPNSGGANLFIDFLQAVAPSTEPTVSGTTGGIVSAVPTTTFPGVVTSPVATTGQIQDLIVGAGGVLGASSGNGVTAGGLPIANFLTIGGYTFSLTSSSTGGTFGGITLQANQFGTSATFGVTGTVMGGALAANTTYNGVFTAQFVNQTPEQVFNTIASGGEQAASFSATFAATQSTVPEPSTYLLLATGIGALGLVARRRRSNV